MKNETAILDYIESDPAYRDKLAFLLAKHKRPEGVRGLPIACAGLAANAYRDMLRSGKARDGDCSAITILFAAIHIAKKVGP